MKEFVKNGYNPCTLLLICFGFCSFVLRLLSYNLLFGGRSLPSVSSGGVVDKHSIF